MTGVFGTYSQLYSFLVPLTHLLPTHSNNSVTVEDALSAECINAVDAGAQLLGWINTYNIFGECTVQTTCTAAGQWGDDDVASDTNLRQVLGAGDAAPLGTYRPYHSLIMHRLTHSFLLGAIDLLHDNMGPQKSKAGLIKHSYYRNNQHKRTNGRQLSANGDDDDYFIYPNFPVEYGPYGCIDSTLGTVPLVPRSFAY